MTETFTADQFKPTKFSTTQDKADFANKFVSFVECGFQTFDFSQEFYERLSNTFGHIAHYDINGFYATYFSAISSQLQFVKQCVDYTPVGGPAWTYSDVEIELRKWLETEKIYEALEKEVNDDYERRERAEYDRLKSKFEGRKQPDRYAKNCVLRQTADQNMTYEQLAKVIEKLPAERRQDNVTIYLQQQDEWFPVIGWNVTSIADVLDEGHFFLEVDA